ncbi:MCE family protein [Nocardia cyriacigeorgica]|uniref:MCE family protein n=1 Tax=Nocardia cyriacigeorgica TaxID=135487 RepID=A0A6P1CPV7_9NOCA|nr:MlaD family protein [Nocardia cyriacigeorgica]MBF6289046.1 MCE family protein [Nocardia cyriacigeorgica]MBF6427136.1 MCE family protein [Nocardia cyriacigeorgica]NEW33404.1 MCE family protein [Nocardia cyriacigeorgica]
MTRLLGRRVRTAAIAVASATALFAGGCAFDPAQVPVPGTSVSGSTYKVSIEFENVLNLPARAKVIANGAQVGTVDSVRVVPAAEAPEGRGGYVVVDIEVSDDVRLPATTIAELRQNTVLGDIHIALTTPPDGFDSLLPRGGTITLDHTKPPVQLEDTMAAMAVFVQGGAVGQLQDIINRFNSVLPQDPMETQRITQVIAGDVVDLAANLDQVDRLLYGLETNSSVLHKIQPELDNILRPESVQQMTDATASISGVTDIFGALAPVGASMTWLTPLLQAGDAAALAFAPLATGAPLNTASPSNLALLTALLRDKIIPFVERGAKVNIADVQVTPAGGAPISADDQVDRIIQTLRMIGAIR